MTEVSNTRLYLGNLPRNGMQDFHHHPSSPPTPTPEVYAVLHWENHLVNPVGAPEIGYSFHIAGHTPMPLGYSRCLRARVRADARRGCLCV